MAGVGEGACREAYSPGGPVVSASPVVLQPCTGAKIRGKPQGAPAGLSSQHRGVLIGVSWLLLQASNEMNLS